MRVTRRFVLGGLAAAAATPALGAPPATSLRPSPRPAGFLKRTVRPAEELIARAELGGKVAYAVADAQTGAILEARNPILPLPPASVTKSVTALYALDALGPGHRFRTKLVATGPVRDGVIDGDLALVGGGDPTLDTDTLGDMAKALKAQGITGVSGRFLVDASALPAIWSIDPGQPDHVGYNPAISALNLNYNRVHFQWERGADGYSVSLDARAERFSPQVEIARMTVVDREMPIYTYSDAGSSDEWTVARPALGTAGSRWLPVRKPHLYAGEVFQTLARAEGLSLPAAVAVEEPVAGEVLVERVSDELRDILEGMLRWSTNLTAEVVGLTATVARGGRPDSLGASAAAMSEWMAGTLGARKTRFVDHSGLGDRSETAATDLVRALVQVGPRGPLRGILKDIEMRDRDGNPIPDSPIEVQAKTGTLNFVSALSGYMTARDGRELAFAILSADMPRRRALEGDDRDRPPGARAWTGRARQLQLDLIDRWGTLYTV